MLINTVILFIKDILPVFILLCFINALIMPTFLNRHSAPRIIAGTLIGAYLIYTNIEYISEQFDGDGIEIFNHVVNLTVYLSLLFASTRLMKRNKPDNTTYFVLLIAITIYAATNFSEFTLFFTTLWASQASDSNILVGSSFGLGICISFSALLYLSLREIEIKARTFSYCLLSLYLASLATKNLKHLQQIDVFDMGSIIWDTSQYILDSSEYGYICNALFGYIASPTVAYAAVYVFSLLISTMLYFVYSQQPYAKEKLNMLGDIK